MWCFKISLTLLFVLKLRECAADDPTTSKSVGANLAISMPTYTQFITNNTKLEVKCVIRGFALGTPPLESLEFVNDDDNKVLTNTDRLKITIINNFVNNETSATFTWNPIYVRDNTVKSVRCRNKDTRDSKSFNIVVIPTASVPKVTIKNGSGGELKLKKGLTHTLLCTVTGKPGSVVKDFSAKWIIGDLNSKETLPPNTDTVFHPEMINGTVTVTSVLTITKASVLNSRKMYCVARMKFDSFDNVRTYYDEVDVEVFGDYGLESVGKEIKKKEGEDARLDCLAMGIPIPTLTWWKKDEYNKVEVEMPVDISSMDARYSHEKSPDKEVESASNSVLVIKDVTYKDRSQYVCRVKFVDRDVNTTFTLRVGDPLGPVWPIVGIVAEAIVLIVVIWYTEACKGKTGKTQKTNTPRDEKAQTMSDLDKEDAPLVSSNKDGSLSNDVPA